MSRYVSVDFIINECEEFDFDGDVVKSISGNIALSVDIVRCEECKFNGVWCDIQDIQWSGYDKPVEWCSYGERTEGE